MTKKEMINCPKCHEDKEYNHCLSRRNVGYPENGRICDDCGTRESFVDFCDDISTLGGGNALHWEYSFHQLCCGNAKQDGSDEFTKLLKFRKKIGKHDPPLWKIKWLIHSTMFKGSSESTWMKQNKARYVEEESKWDI